MLNGGRNHVRRRLLVGNVPKVACLRAVAWEEKRLVVEAKSSECGCLLDGQVAYLTPCCRQSASSQGQESEALK